MTKPTEDFFSLISLDQNLYLETARLHLEPVLESHAIEIFPLLSEPSLYTFLPSNPLSIEKLQERYRIWSKRQSPDGKEIWLNWLARDQNLGELIGHFQAGLDGKNGFSVAYMVGKDYQRKAYATEALQVVREFLCSKLEARKIRSWVDTRNEPSIRLMESLGFKQVELIKHADEFKGSISDEFIFEWKS